MIMKYHNVHIPRAGLLDLLERALAQRALVIFSDLNVSAAKKAALILQRADLIRKATAIVRAGLVEMKCCFLFR